MFLRGRLGLTFDGLYKFKKYTAFLIVAPLSILYGLLSVMALSVGVSELTNDYLVIKSTKEILMFVWLLLSGGFTLFGILGVWLYIFFYRQLNQQVKPVRLAVLCLLVLGSMGLLFGVLGPSNSVICEYLNCGIWRLSADGLEPFFSLGHCRSYYAHRVGISTIKKCPDLWDFIFVLMFFIFPIVFVFFTCKLALSIKRHSSAQKTSPNV